ncbi:hypothetical protein [Longimycelium tulufanense]|uniref:hypothetical protein n=1 Tax=Longimycelium tulufanense TaxID=907463 RepID=UPI0016676D38|nr:hypothetical protein [Longimycelium tulufanense]
MTALVHFRTEPDLRWRVEDERAGYRRLQLGVLDDGELIEVEVDVPALVFELEVIRPGGHVTADREQS